MKSIKTSKQAWSGSIDRRAMEKFKREISRQSINEELIGLLEQYLSDKEEIEEKLAYLFFAKKVLPYLKREPDPDHLFAFEDEYRKDRETFDPMQWLAHEIEFWTNIRSLERPKETPQSIVEAKRELGKQWLTREEMMDMLKISRTTLNRRIADGMPCHQKGGSVFFNLEEVSEWLKDDDAA